MQQIQVSDLKVVLVEDESGSRTMLRQLLRLAGVKVSACIGQWQCFVAAI